MGKQSAILTAPTPDIFMMENHDEAYRVWRDSGLQEKILVHIDAHDDLVWLPEQGALNIANFICPALKEGIVREVYWVVPDQTWDNRRSRKRVLRRLQRVFRRYSGERFRLVMQQDRLSGLALGKPVQVCPLSSLPVCAEPVLLDIDVDYLVIPRACSASDQFRELPWCWPDELVHRLEARSLQAELVTIAYSVEGGYTPLKWKYLGDELAERLQGAGDRDPYIRGMLLLRQGARAAAQGALPQAAEQYLRAGEFLPQHPAPDYHLAEVYLDLGREEEAREHRRRALLKDASYRTAYNSGGVWYYFERQTQQAEEEHRRSLALDPEDSYACLGLAMLAARRKNWADAEVWARKAMHLDGNLVDAHRILGQSLAKTGRTQEAIAAYEHSLLLSLRGYIPITGGIYTFNETGLLMDPEHFKVHTIIGQLYYLQNESGAAIISFRMGIAAGDNGFVTRSRLGRVYWKQGRWAAAVLEAWAAIRMIPRDVWNAVQGSFYRVRHTVKNRYRALAGKR
jgi:tetratricopeptide (TPR) repeat protein